MFIQPSKEIVTKAKDYIDSRIADDKLSSDVRLGKSSRYYLVKLKYKGIKEIELYGLTSVGKKGVRNFGWVLLEFGNYGIGGRGGVISLSEKSKELSNFEPIYSTYLEQFDIETNVESYKPLTKYENAEIIIATQNKLIIRDSFNSDLWTIKKGIKSDNFTELVEYINSMKNIPKGGNTQKRNKWQIPSTELLELNSKSPFKKSKTLPLRRALESEEYTSNPEPLLIPLGKSEDGQIVTIDMRKVGCILTAGQTGSGKSNFTEGALIMSLLMRNTPEDLQLLLIDPKMVQFSQYKGIPHLLTPPIKTPDEAREAFDDLLTEIDRRKELFTAESLNDIDEYSSKIQKLPFIMVVIDEVIDLFMVDGDYYEKTFNTIAKNSKTTGVYLYMGTSRPSRDAYTPNLLSHFPTRIAFTVASEYDSDTLIEEPGAEKLSGAGELIYKESIESKPIRLQSPYATDDDHIKIADFWKNNLAN